MVVRVLLCLVLAPFAAHALPITAGGPGGVGTTDGTSELIVWLKPGNTATNGQIVGVLSPPDPWSDSSGYSNHFDWHNSVGRPVWTNNVINGQAAVAFDGVDDRVRMPAGGAYSDNDNESLFLVHDRDDNADSDSVLGDDNINYPALWKKPAEGWQWGLVNFPGGKIDDAGHGETIDGLQMIVGVRSVSLATMTLYDQGGFLKENTSFSNTTGTTRYTLAKGGSPDNPFGGLIAEFVAFKTNLNTVQRYLVENYLCSKFDMTLTGRDFYAGDTAGNGDYDFDVFGIGRLSASDEVTSAGQAGLGIAAHFGLSDNQWILAGHKVTNNVLVSLQGPGGAFQHWVRVWYVDVTGTIDARLSFDFSDAGLSQQGSNYELLYSAVNAFSWSTVDDAVASVDGDRMHFDVPAANMVDGYYTVGYPVEVGALVIAR